MRLFATSQGFFGIFSSWRIEREREREGESERKFEVTT